jgi:hypothetical protein
LGKTVSVKTALFSAAHDKKNTNHSQYYPDDLVAGNAFFQEKGRKNKYAASGF